jgi:hypothetical protein
MPAAYCGDQMLQQFPYLAWIPPAASVVLLVVAWKFSGVNRRSVVPLLGAFLVAAYAQWVVRSPLVNSVGVVLQTLLAIYLAVRLKVGR